HAGVEWKWWPGPQECSGPLTDLSTGGDLLSSLTNLTIIRCDEAAWRFLGLSLAGYDVLISFVLAAIAAFGAAAAWGAAQQKPSRWAKDDSKRSPTASSPSSSPSWCWR